LKIEILVSKQTGNLIPKGEKKMTNNQNNDFQANKNQETSQNEQQTDTADFGETKQAQNLDGGERREGGQKVGQFGDDDFMQTDQTITQAAPGQTATSTNQGSGNA
jgi:hypothetical protein